VFPRVAAAAGCKAQEQGVARLAKSREDLYEEAAKVMGEAREATRLLMLEGLIAAPPETRR
jgi:malate dehydrogenase (oxaloacetate-decarboxylating)